MELISGSSFAALKEPVEGLHLAEPRVALAVLDPEYGVVGNPRLGCDVPQSALVGL